MFGFCLWKSSAASLAAIREPCPLESDSGPLASVITPILTTPPDSSPARASDPNATMPARAIPAMVALQLRPNNFIPNPPGDHQLSMRDGHRPEGLTLLKD